jgi:hypothetical protein
MTEALSKNVAALREMVAELSKSLRDAHARIEKLETVAHATHKLKP